MFTIMAEREEMNRQYAYSAMSNMVTQADRSARRSRGGDGTGEVETLRGRTDIGRMGDALAGGKRGGGGPGDADKNKELEEIRERANRKRMKRDKGSGGAAAAATGAAAGEAGHSKRSRKAGVEWSGGGGILDMGEISGYRPTTVGARSNYEAMLVRVHHKTANACRADFCFVCCCCCPSVLLFIS